VKATLRDLSQGYSHIPDIGIADYHQIKSKQKQKQPKNKKLIAE
jgi:hypothetical protein